MTNSSNYTHRIAAAIDYTDEATTALIERLMRDQTGTLDHLAAAEFDQLARQAYADARTWDTVGAIQGLTLADYCTANGITRPRWVISPKEYHEWQTNTPASPSSEAEQPPETP